MDELEENEIRVDTGETELIVTRDKLDSFIVVLGAEVDDENYIRDIETGDRWQSPSGETFPIEEVGYLGVDDNGENVIVKDSFPRIVSFLSDRDFRDE